MTAHLSGGDRQARWTSTFATAGAGGIALDVWALRAYGVSGADAAGGLVCYEVVTYAVYLIAVAVAVAGFGLGTGAFPGHAPLALTLIPACIATAVILLALSMMLSTSARSAG